MRKKNVAENQNEKAAPKTIEERLESIDSKLDKTSRWTIILAVVGALLGTGGLAGIYSINSQVSINQAQARQKDAEAASKELEIIALNHAKTIESFRRIIEHLAATNQRNEVEEVQKILIDAELDFQKRLMQQRNPKLEEEAARIKQLQISCIDRLEQLQTATKNTQSRKPSK